LNYLKKFTLPFILLTAVFSGCGENTQSTLVPDVKEIKIDETNISIYSTDVQKNLHASILYDDNSSQDGTNIVKWSSSNQNAVKQFNNTIQGGTQNGGDAEISIKYAQFSNTQSVHVHKLLSYTIVHDDVNTTGGPFTFEAKGTFDNNETNRTIQTHIFWSANNSATVDVVDGVANITFVAGETNVTTTLFEDTNASSPIAPQSVTINIP